MSNYRGYYRGYEIDTNLFGEHVARGPGVTLREKSLDDLKIVVDEDIARREWYRVHGEYSSPALAAGHIYGHDEEIYGSSFIAHEAELPEHIDRAVLQAWIVAQKRVIAIRRRDYKA